MMPSWDCVCPLARACACVTCPTMRVPFFSTTLPSCLMSCSARASTSSPTLLLFASREVASDASIFVPLEMLAELLPALAFAVLLDDIDDDAPVDPLLEACAPELFVCTVVCDCVEAPACPEAVVCAAATEAPNIPIARTESIRFMKSPPIG